MFQKGADKYPGETALWIHQLNPISIFENINRSIIWSEYKNDDQKVAEYVLYKQTAVDLILQNKKDAKMYTVLSKTGYANGSIDFVSNPQTPKDFGFWLYEPDFPNSINLYI